MGFRIAFKDDEKAAEILHALNEQNRSRVFAGKELALMKYAEILTKAPTEATAILIQDLRETGLEDGEILEASQIIGYFAYANRVVLGLGVNNDGEILGISPSNPEVINNKLE